MGLLSSFRMHQQLICVNLKPSQNVVKEVANLDSKTNSEKSSFGCEGNWDSERGRRINFTTEYVREMGTFHDTAQTQQVKLKLPCVASHLHEQRRRRPAEFPDKPDR